MANGTFKVYNSSTQQYEAVNVKTIAENVKYSDTQDVKQAIDALKDLVNDVSVIYVVNTIAERNAIVDIKAKDEVFVIDATADETVETGWARYMYVGTEFVKIAEGESLDNVNVIDENSIKKMESATGGRLTVSTAGGEVAESTLTPATITDLVTKVDTLEDTVEGLGTLEVVTISATEPTEPTPIWIDISE